jgi:hypothetical protein
LNSDGIDLLAKSLAIGKILQLSESLARSSDAGNPFSHVVFIIHWVSISEASAFHGKWIEFSSAML